MAVQFEPVRASDFEALVVLREAVLRESLERLGLFQSERSRARFQAQFRPEFMRHVIQGGTRVGLLTVWPEEGALWVQHLYVAPGWQNQGLGSQVLRQVQQDARLQRRDIVLEALKLSASNRFYLRHGFRAEAELEHDIRYRWRAAEADAVVQVREGVA